MVVAAGIASRSVAFQVFSNTCVKKFVCKHFEFCGLLLDWFFSMWVFARFSLLG